MVYNDFVICDAPFGKIFARYVCSRPDKNTIVVDYEDNLHELNFSVVKPASREVIEGYYEHKLSYYNSCISRTKSDLNDAKIFLKNNIKALNEYLEKQPKLISEVDSLKVMKEIDDYNHQESDTNDKIESMENSLYELNIAIKETESAIQKFKSNIDYYKKRLKLFNKNKKSWEKEKQNHLGGLE